MVTNFSGVRFGRGVSKLLQGGFRDGEVGMCIGSVVVDWLREY